MGLADHVVDWLRPLRFRGKGRLFNRLIAKEGTRSATVFGSRVELDLSDLIQRQVYLGVYEREETNRVLSYLRPGMTFLDVGANIGYYTLMAASRVGPGGRVIAVEPSPYAVERLEKAVRENGLAQVKVVRGGLGSCASELKLFVPAPGNHTPTMLGEDGAPAHVVSVKTLDSCLADWGVETIDLMKMDVEGFEPRVLEGAASALAAGRIRAILCEFNDYWLRRAGTNGGELYESLLAQGFVDRDGRPDAFDGQVMTRLLVQTAQPSECANR
jgi:FkbM family methyltransferase